MDKSVKTPSGAKKINDRNKNADKGAPVRARSEQPAQKIADDEVEIAETGGKPGEGGRPITSHSQK